MQPELALTGYCREFKKKSQRNASQNNFKYDKVQAEVAQGTVQLACTLNEMFLQVFTKTNMVCTGTYPVHMYWVCTSTYTKKAKTIKRASSGI